jgi:hypothetical protein
MALDGKALRSTPLEPGAEPLEKTLSSAVVLAPLAVDEHQRVVG